MKKILVSSIVVIGLSIGAMASENPKGDIDKLYELDRAITQVTRSLSNLENKENSILARIDVDIKDKESLKIRRATLINEAIAEAKVLLNEKDMKTRDTDFEKIYEKYEKLIMTEKISYLIRTVIPFKYDMSVIARYSK